jgi:hypothetical protein
MPRQHRPATFALLAGIALLAGTAGCANLQAVRGFASASAASADAPQVIADYADAPDWSRRYEPADKAAELDALAARRKAQREELLAVQGVLVSYFTSLGDLAADELPNVTDPVDGFFQQLKGMDLVTDETASAASSMADVLIRAGMNGWRKHKLAQLVVEADPHLQAVVAGLKDLVENDFQQSLDGEQEAVQRRFLAWEAAVRKRDPDGAPPVIRVLLAEHLDVVEQRRAAARAYVAALTKIGEGHASLARSSRHLDTAELKQELRTTVQELRTLYKAIRQLGQ